MPVYIAEAVGTGIVKIGRSRSPHARLQELQIAHWHPLRIIRVIGGEHGVEKWMHRRYSDRHIRSEWFHFTEEMLTVEPGEHADLARLGAMFEPVKDEAIRLLNERPDLSQRAIADQLNVPFTRFGNWIAALRRHGLVADRRRQKHEVAA